MPCPLSPITYHLILSDENHPLFGLIVPQSGLSKIIPTLNSKACSMVAASHIANGTSHEYFFSPALRLKMYFSLRPDSRSQPRLEPVPTHFRLAFGHANVLLLSPVAVAVRPVVQRLTV